MTPSESSPDLWFVYLSGIGTFLGTLATMVWRVGAAKSALEEKILESEHSAELELSRLRQDVLQAKLDSVTTFVTKDSFEGVMKTIDARLIRLESKLDRILDKSFKE